jgi:hypothetical protein
MMVAGVRNDETAGDVERRSGGVGVNVTFFSNNCHLHNFLMKIENNLEHIEFCLFYKD